MKQFLSRYRRRLTLTGGSLVLLVGLSWVVTRPFGAPFPSTGTYPAARYVVGRLVARGGDVRIIPFPWVGSGFTVTNAHSPVTEAAIAARTGHWVKAFGPVLGSGSARGLLLTWLNGQVILDLAAPLTADGITGTTGGFDARTLTDDQRSCLTNELGADTATAYVDGRLTEMTTVQSLGIGQCLTTALPPLPAAPPPLEDTPTDTAGGES
jgi:hypothetical protein